jgi:hypothetical protein
MTRMQHRGQNPLPLGEGEPLAKRAVGEGFGSGGALTRLATLGTLSQRERVKRP